MMKTSVFGHLTLKTLLLLQGKEANLLQTLIASERLERERERERESPQSSLNSLILTNVLN